jgi:uracil-DNA glycosylase
MEPAEIGRKLGALAAQIRNCTKCPLHASRTVAVPAAGKPSAAVMIIGEAPGKEENISGRPFVGAAGRFLDQVLADNGLRREDLFITNVVKCRPPGNRVPRREEIETGTTRYLFEQITLHNPLVVIIAADFTPRHMCHSWLEYSPRAVGQNTGENSGRGLRPRLLRA